jgi:hypothetical protein
VGVATASVTFFRQMGSTIGVALLGTVFASTLSTELSTRTARATAGLPPEVREHLQLQGTGGSGEKGARVGQTLPSDQLERSLRSGFAAREQQVRTELRGADRTEALTQLKAEEQHAVAAVGELEAALKDGFTRAISAIYRIAIFISVVGFLLTLFLPELPLRRTNAPLPPE